jgi:hypothetical protein
MKFADIALSCTYLLTYLKKKYFQLFSKRCDVFILFHFNVKISYIYESIKSIKTDITGTQKANNTKYGASVAKWLAHLPFTSEAAGSNLTKYFLNATRTQSSCEKSKKSTLCRSRGFSPGTPVSSHRES